jgi:hypothetical protein
MYKGKIPYSIFIYIIFGGLMIFIITPSFGFGGSEFKFFGFLIYIFCSSLCSIIIFFKEIRDSIYLSYLTLLIPTIVGMFLYFKEFERDVNDTISINETITSEIIKYVIFYILQFIYWYTILRPRKVLDDEEG